MNTKPRLVIVLLITLFSLILVWPNISERTVNVFFLPNADLEKVREDVEAFLTRNYKDQYTWKRAQIEVPKHFAKKDAKPTSFAEKSNTITTSVIQVRGYFIQSAFMNELARIEGVDGERIALIPIWTEDNLKASPFKLGLDLQGGMNIVMRGDFKEYLEEKRRSLAKVEEQLKNLKDPKKKDEKQALENEARQLRSEMNLTPEAKSDIMQRAVDILRGRIDSTGVSEPLIRVQGADQIEVALPGVSSPERAKQVLKSTAQVAYYLTESLASSVGKYTQEANKLFENYLEQKSDQARSIYLADVAKKINLPEDKFKLVVEWFRDENTREMLPSRFIVVDKEPMLRGDDLESNSRADYDSKRFQHIVYFTIKDDEKKYKSIENPKEKVTAADRFGELTSKYRKDEDKNYPGRSIATVIDEKVRSVAVISDRIRRSGTISGSFSAQEARDLANIINEGALPIPMQIVAERSEGPTLGQEAIDNGVSAIFLGLIAVIIFMFFYYHIGGIIATLALIMNLLLMSAILAWMDFTITLPGLAGVVLTLGMAVDANVIIYERIREEIGRGKSMKLAVAQGFERATLTILDSNLTTMVAAIVLAKFGVGPIKGFAVTLFIGILTSLFTSLFVSKTLFTLMIYDLNIKSISLGWGKYKSAAIKEPQGEYL